MWTESTPPGRAWGRARFPHTKPVRLDDGRWLATRQVAAHLSGRDVDLIRKLVPPVAYDVSGHHGHEPSPSCLKCQKTAPALVDMDEVEKALAGRPFADRKRRTPLRLE